jgi:hypothetical protein
VTARDAAGNALAAPVSWSFTTLREEFQVYLPLVLRQSKGWW